MFSTVRVVHVVIVLTNAISSYRIVLPSLPFPLPFSKHPYIRRKLYHPAGTSWSLVVIQKIEKIDPSSHQFLQPCAPPWLLARSILCSSSFPIDMRTTAEVAPAAGLSLSSSVSLAPNLPTTRHWPLWAGQTCLFLSIFSFAFWVRALQRPKLPTVPD